MATLKELEDAFLAADEAGNAEDAQFFADEIRRMQAAPAPSEGPAPEEPTSEESATPDTMSLLQRIDDLGIGLVGGAVRGTASIPGLPGSLQQWLKTHPETDLGQLAGSLPDYPFNAQESIAGFEDVAGKIPEAKTTLGQYGESVGEFLSPSPGKKAKIASEVATAVGGGAGTKLLSDLGESLELSPEWMGMLGSVLGIWGANKARGGSTVTRAADNAPSPSELDTLRKNAYADVEQYTGLDQQQYAQTVSNIAADFTDAGVTRAEAPAIIKRVEDTLDQPSISFNDVETTRKKANRIANDHKADGETRHAADIVRRRLDEFFDTVNASDPTFTPKVHEARDLGRAKIHSSAVSEARDKGKYGVTGEALSEANKVRAYLTQQDRGLTPLEQEAGVRAVGREGVKTPLRGVGRILSSSPLQALGLLGGTSIQSFWPIAASIASTLTGKSMENLADLVSRKKMEQLEAVFRSGKAGQQKAIEEFTKIVEGRRSAATSGILGVFKSEEANRYQRNKNRGQQ